MGCIEINNINWENKPSDKFNRNMGCIEMLLDNGKVTAIVV